MNNIQKKFLDFCNNNIGNPYVWSGSGEELTLDNYETFIDSKENNPLNAKRAKNFCKKAFDSGKNVLNAFDCSGYISKALIFCGLRTWRGNCDALWDKCKKTNVVRDFTLLFRVSDSDSEDETHVGVYYNGNQYHAKGRDDGVVKETFKKSFWHKFGNYEGLNDVLSDYIFKQNLKFPMYDSKDVKELKKLLKKNGFGLNLNSENGNFLGSTKQAVISFQKAYFDDPKEWDGIVGKKTISALGGIWKN